MYAATAKSLQSCPPLCDPIDSSPPVSPVPGILQARTLEWVAISFFNARKWKVKVKSLSCVWLLATPWTDYSLPGSSIHGVFQARVLKWGAIAFSVKMYKRTKKKFFFKDIAPLKDRDCVDHNKLWNILQEMGIPDHLTCLLRYLCADQESTVRTGNGTTDW